MIYSIGKNLGNKLTGIEQAMINRLKLFKYSHLGHHVYICMHIR